MSQVRALLLGSHVRGSPFVLTVTPAASSAASSAIEDRPTEALRAGERASFDVVLRDACGNDVPGASRPAVAITADGGALDVPLRREFVGGARHRVEFALPRRGEYSVAITI